MNDLVKRNEGELMVFNEDQIDLIKRTICQGASDDELKLFLYVCKKKGLDPFTKQIHAVFRNSKNSDGTWGKVMAIQTGIDGYRLIALRTGEYIGNSDPVFEWNNKPGQGYPTSAKVNVKRLVKGVTCEFSATAYWDEYYPGEKMGHLWRKMPRGMLGKCAESLALRKAFPNELSGLLTDTEMIQADAKEEEIKLSHVETERIATIDLMEQDKQIQVVLKLMAKVTEGQTLEEKAKFLQETIAITSVKELTKFSNKDLDAVIEQLNEMIQGGSV